MVEATIIQSALCPWCHNAIDIMRSEKSGYHYANCKYCNAHFRNIPIAMIDPDKNQNHDDNRFKRVSKRREVEENNEPLIDKLYRRFVKVEEGEEYEGLPKTSPLQRFLKRDD